MTYHIWHVSKGEYLCKDDEGDLYYSRDIMESMSFDRRKDAKEQLNHTPWGKLEHNVL